MEKLEPIKLLDEVLNFIKVGEDWKTLKVIHAHFRSINIELTKDDLKRILLKLMQDKYVVYNHIEDYKYDHYMATYNGVLFQGYDKQHKYDKIINRNRRIRTFALAWGTVLAGIAASALLAWQIWIYYHPEPIPVNVKIQTEKKH